MSNIPDINDNDFTDINDTDSLDLLGGGASRHTHVWLYLTILVYQSVRLQRVLIHVKRFIKACYDNISIYYALSIICFEYYWQCVLYTLIFIH